MTTDATRRPRSVTLAVVLLILGTFVAASTAADVDEAPQFVALLSVLCLWFAVRAGRGRRIARRTVTCLTALLLLFVSQFAFDDPLYGGATLLFGALLAVPGLVLLYLPAAEAYVRARGEEAGT
jgi:4-amino-4-deoxy-L-arabinose transferase-like glycosyltransferase